MAEEYGGATTQPHRKLTRTPTVPFLPDELIFHILTLLPDVKSLLRCKCVSKSWLHIISHPLFTRTHLHSSTRNPSHHHHLNFIFISRPTLSLRTCSLHSLLHPDPTRLITTVDIPEAREGHGSWAQIVGVCNGLVCIAGLTYTLSFWNPSTRISKRTVYGCSEAVRCNVVHGFGYDELRDDYKVVMVYWRNYDAPNAFVRVYSLRTDSWRRIEDFPGGRVPAGGSGKFVNGSLHWLTRDAPGLPVIVSLGLADERYLEVPQPDYGDSDFSLELGVLRDCVSVLCTFPRSHADIWVMGEYGKKGSWVKVASVPYLTDPGLTRYSTPLWVSGNGSMVLMEFGNSLVLYNSKEKKLEYRKIRKYDPCWGVHTYVESLVSPNFGENNRNA